MPFVLIIFSDKNVIFGDWDVYESPTGHTPWPKVLRMTQLLIFTKSAASVFLDPFCQMFTMIYTEV